MGTQAGADLFITYTMWGLFVKMTVVSEKNKDTCAALCFASGIMCVLDLAHRLPAADPTLLCVCIYICNTYCLSKSVKKTHCSVVVNVF